jgi:hypothetical protein
MIVQNYDKNDVFLKLTRISTMNMKCSFCSHDSYADDLGFFYIEGQKDIAVGRVPTIILCCNNCGLLTSHSLITLGFEPECNFQQREKINDSKDQAEQKSPEWTSSYHEDPVSKTYEELVAENFKLSENYLKLIDKYMLLADRFLRGETQ